MSSEKKLHTNERHKKLKLTMRSQHESALKCWIVREWQHKWGE